MNGKNKCNLLKQIRKDIAKKNDIPYIVDECKHEGECRGTCPKCESEVKYLEKELNKKKIAGKAVAIAGASAVCAGMLTGCTPSEAANVLRNLANQIEVSVEKETTSPQIDIAGEIEHIPDELSGYIAEQPETQPETEPEIVELDGEVAIIDD